jgi:large subunit ribosomal protein L4e
VFKVLEEKVNKKEKRKALRSAIAATANETLVRARGHRFDCPLPIVVEDTLEGLRKTEEVAATLQTLGMYPDIARSKESRKVRAGRGKLRGRRFKQRKSILIVTSAEPLRAALNLPGVDAVSVTSLNTELLAPGTLAGRLTVWTEGALKHLGGMEE